MIKAFELRIGNKFQCDAGVKTVNGTDKFGFIYFEKYEPSARDSRRHQSQCSPLNISPEILLKCGFVKGERRGFEAFCHTNPSAINIAISFLHDSIRVFLNGIYQDVNELYLHQLQNIYFSINGEELQINL